MWHVTHLRGARPTEVRENSMDTLTTAVCAVTLSAAALLAQSALELTTPETFQGPDGETLKYRLHAPAGLPAGKKVPLILFLHGAGERGDDNALQLKHGVTDLIRYSLTNGGAVVVAPQCPQGMQWVNTNWNAPSHSMPSMPSTPLKLTLLLLQDLLAKQPVDPARVYVTGVSMGGYGTWDVIQRKPGLFAAAIPICGGGDSALAPTLKNIPIWAFHGDADTAVPVTRSRDMVAALKAAGGKVEYREYEKAGHDVWTRTYADKAVLKWLFAQKRPAAAKPKK
jgi:predicted peptidase